MTEWSGESGRMTNPDSSHSSADEQSEYYPNDEADTDSPPLDPAIPTTESDPEPKP